MRKFSTLVAALWALAPLSRAVETRTWQQDAFSDFEKGTLKRLSLGSDGRLSLAPSSKELLDSSTPYLWSAAEDSKGNVYAGGGGPGASTAKLFVIDRGGKSRTLAELPGMEIHAIAVDRRDRVYAATSPDGKVYRLASNGKPEIFYDPKSKYVWAMAFDGKGNLYVATGDQGEVHRVGADGKGSVFFKTEETHARSLAIDGGDNVIVGTEPGGLILRISPAGEGFVLYQAAKREITAVGVASNGVIYAAAVGNKTPSSPVMPPPSPVPAAPAPSPATPGVQGVQRVQLAPVPPPTLGSSSASISGGSEVYRVDTDGFARKVWSDNQEIAYAIGFDAQGRPLVGTGNKGNLYRLDSDILSTLLLNLSPTQITAISSGRSDAVHVVTGNIGKVYRVGPATEKDGYFESEPLDAGFFSYWGRLTVHSEAKGGKIAIETRSGNLDRPQKNWTPWAPVKIEGDGGRIASPPARFVQYRATLSEGSGGSPELTGIEVAYLPKNVPPIIEQIEITPANYKFPAATAAPAASQPALTLQPLGQRKRTTSTTVSLDSTSVSMNYAKGVIGVRWAAKDDNGDTLQYKMEIRGENEKEWKPLKDKVREKYFSWDSSAFPDGWYRVRVTATDAPNNPPGQALSNSLESDLFLIDNTPPQVIGLAASASGGRISARWKAKDAYNIVAKAEYALDGGDWLVVEPVTKLSDSQELDYVLEIPNVAPGEHTLAVRVTDDYDNQAVEKAVVR